MKKENNVLNYIKKYGDYTFNLIEFNEIDSLILSSISYINFEDILKNHSNELVSISDSGKIFFQKYSKKDLKSNVFSVQTGIKVFKAIYNTKRFGNLLLSKYLKVVDENKQFQALCININDKLSYISFEGTDDLVSGWYEDAAMSYKFPVPSQREAINYVNRHISPFSRKSYILGGHSKGGNLALVAGMYGRNFVKSKIKAIYMFDSPGIREEQFNTKNFKTLEPKIKRVVTNYSVVGLLFKNIDSLNVVKSLKKGVMAHNLINWCIDEDKFSYTDLSASSKKFKKGIEDWLNSYNDQEREEFVHDLFSLFKRADIKSLLDIKKNKIKKLHTLIKESKKLDLKSREIVNTFLKFLIEFIKEESTSKISEKLPSLKH